MCATITSFAYDLIASNLYPADFLALKLVSKTAHRLLSNRAHWQNADLQVNHLIYLAVVERRNLLIIGSAGCGKSYALRQVAKASRKRKIAVASTASTGIAATALRDGQTLHSFSGLRLGKESLETLLQRPSHRIPGAKRYRSTQLLLVDEVSMVGASLLDKIDAMAKRARNHSRRALGGLQTILSGDFLQLAPIGDRYAFESPVWEALNMRVIELTIPMRQYGDLRYFDLLSRIRTMSHTAEDIALLQTRVISPQDVEKMFPTFHIKPTQIFCKNLQVKEVNEREFAKLTTPIDWVSTAQDTVVEKVRVKDDKYIYIASTSISLKEAQDRVASQLIRSCPDVLQFRAGCQLILTRNLSVKEGYVNGSRCVYEGERLFAFKNGKTRELLPQQFRFPIRENYYLQRIQLPVRLGYCISTHSSQSLSLDSAIIDVGRDVFSSSQIYVALSRVRSLNSLYLLNFDPQRIRCNAKALAFYRNGYRHIPANRKRSTPSTNEHDD